MRGSNKIFNNRNNALDIEVEMKKVEGAKEEMLIRENFLSLVSMINTSKVNRIWINNTNSLSVIVIDKIDHIKLVGSIFLNKYRQKYAPGTIERNRNAGRIVQDETEKILREKLELNTKEMLLKLIQSLKSDDFDSLHISKRDQMIGFYSKDIGKDFIELIIKTLEEYYLCTYSSGTITRKHTDQ